MFWFKSLSFPYFSLTVVMTLVFVVFISRYHPCVCNRVMSIVSSLLASDIGIFFFLTYNIFSHLWNRVVSEKWGIFFVFDLVLILLFVTHELASLALHLQCVRQRSNLVHCLKSQTLIKLLVVNGNHFHGMMIIFVAG